MYIYARRKKKGTINLLYVVIHDDDDSYGDYSTVTLNM